MKEAKVPVLQAAEIAGIGGRTARTWVQEGWIGWKADRITSGQGEATFLSRNSVLALTIAANLANMGMSPAQACKAARRFTDLGDDARGPAELFPKGLTALVAFADGEASVLRADKEVLFAAFSSRAGRKPRAYLLHLGDFVMHVDQALQRLAGGSK